MKTTIKRTSATLLFAAIMTLGLMAQPQYYGSGQRLGPGWNAGERQNFNSCMNIPDLTEDQITQLQALRLEQVKTSQNYRNQMGEIRARQRTLMTEYPIDQKAVGNLVDEKTTLMNIHLKDVVAHKAIVSEILTEEQQIYMNQMQNRRQQFAPRGGNRGNNFRQGGPAMRRGQGRAAGYNRNSWCR